VGNIFPLVSKGLMQKFPTAACEQVRDVAMT
jgi:hypothetical protein